VEDLDAVDAVDQIIEQWGRERPDLETGPMEVFGRVYRIARRMGDRMEQVYAVHGLSRADTDVLLTLRRAGEPYRLNPKDLAASTMITTGGMTGRLDSLERAGLVRRLPDPADRRCLLIELTARGRQLVDLALVDGLEEQRGGLAGLDAASLRRLADALRAVLNNLEQPVVGRRV
jgi:DNA-binding MarR family transcriptional regulator